MYNTCVGYLKKYTIYMDQADWFKLDHFYRTYDANAVISEDSVIRECHKYEYDDQILGCTFELGYIEDAAERGLVEPVQRRAGFMNPVDSLGVLWYDDEWV